MTAAAHRHRRDQMIVGVLFNYYLAAIVPCLHYGEINLDSDVSYCRYAMHRCCELDVH